MKYSHQKESLASRILRQATFIAALVFIVCTSFPFYKEVSIEGVPYIVRAAHFCFGHTSIFHISPVSSVHLTTPIAALSLVGLILALTGGLTALKGGKVGAAFAILLFIGAATIFGLSHYFFEIKVDVITTGKAEAIVSQVYTYKDLKLIFSWGAYLMFGAITVAAGLAFARLIVKDKNA